MPTNLTLSGSNYSFDTTVKKFGSASIKFTGNQSNTDVYGPKVPQSGDYSVGNFCYWTAGSFGCFFAQGSLFFVGCSNDGRIYALYGSGSNRQEFYSPSGKTYNDGNPHWIEINYSATNGLTIYADAVAVITSASTEAQVGGDRTKSPVSFGASPDVGFHNAFNMDEAIICSFARGGAVPTSAFAGTETGLVDLYHLDGDGSDSVSSAKVTIAANDNSLLYSPTNWNGATAQDNRTINGGAYMRVMVNGGCNLNFTTSSLGSPTSKVAWRINGQPWNDSVVAPQIPVTIPAVLVGPWHLLELVVISTSQQLGRWGNNSPTQIIFTGITSASTSFATKAPVKRPGSNVFLGDSITEGVRTQNYTAANDTDQNDARSSWAWLVGEWLGGEFGIVGFGGQGWIAPGNGMPAGMGLQNSWNLVNAGVARTWPSDLRNVFINMGTNPGDGAGGTATDAQITAAVQTFLVGTGSNGILAATASSGASIVFMRPFNGSEWAAQRAGIAAVGSARVFKEDTTGVFDTSYGCDDTQLHPTSGNNRARIAPALMSMFGKYSQGRTYTLQAAA